MVCGCQGKGCRKFLSAETAGLRVLSTGYELVLLASACGLLPAIEDPQ